VIAVGVDPGTSRASPGGLVVLVDGRPDYWRTGLDWRSSRGGPDPATIGAVVRELAGLHRPAVVAIERQGMRPGRGVVV